jgi:hypothetical protein
MQAALAVPVEKIVVVKETQVPCVCIKCLPLRFELRISDLAWHTGLMDEADPTHSLGVV